MFVHNPDSGCYCFENHGGGGGGVDDNVVDGNDDDDDDDGDCLGGSISVTVIIKMVPRCP